VVGEVLGPQVGDAATLAERLDDQVGRLLVLGAGPGAQLDGLDPAVLLVEVLVHGVLDREGGLGSPRRRAGVEVVRLGVVLGECAVGVLPPPKIVHPPPDLLGPIAKRVRIQRELGIGLGGA
jgi:hypothetical protein